MRVDMTGTRVLRFVGKLCLPAISWQLLPRREVRYRIEYGGRWLTVQYLPFRGYWALRINAARDPNGVPSYECPRPCPMAMKRRLPVNHKDLPGIPLPMTSAILMKLTLMREFLTEVNYEDGSVRQPGYFTLRNKGTQFEITLYDPDAGMRLPCRGLLIDDCFALAEKLLGTENAPWEKDDYLTSRLTEKKKRK